MASATRRHQVAVSPRFGVARVGACDLGQDAEDGQIVTHAGSPLLDVEGVPSLDLIAQQKLIGFKSCRSTRWAEERLRETGRNPEFVLRSEDNGIVQAMAAAGLGVALVPLLAVDTSDPAVRIIPTDLDPRRIALVWHRDRYRSPATLAFIEVARDVCAGLAAELSLGPGAHPAASL